MFIIDSVFLKHLLKFSVWRLGRFYGILIIIINTLFEIGKNLHSSVKNLQSNLYQLKIIIIIKWINKNNK